MCRLLNLLERQGRYAEARLLLEQSPGDRSALSAHWVEVALGLGEYDAAIEELRRRVAADTGDAISRIVLARLIYQETQDIDAAFDLLDEAEKEGVDLTAALITRARLLAEEGRDVEAVALLDAEVARRNDPAAYRLRAGYYAFTGRLELAEQDLVHLTRLPDAVAADYAALGRFYQQSGRITEAVAAFDAGLKVDPDSDPLRRLLLTVLLGRKDGSAQVRGEGLLAQLLAELPDDPDLLILKARLLLADKSAEATQEGERNLERVTRIDPHSVVAHMLLIQLAQQQGDEAQIDARITQALGANPENAELILARAKLEDDRGNLEVAWALARSVLETGSISPLALNPLTELAIRHGEAATALSLNDTALALDPTNETTQILRASILSLTGELDGAIRELEAYRQTEPGRGSLVVLLALAETYREQGDLKKAGERLDQASVLAPDNQAILPERLRLLAKQERYEEIVSAVSDPRLEDTRNPQPLLLAAWILASTRGDNHLHQARILFERALTIDENSVNGHFGLATVIHAQGDLEECVKQYRLVLEQDPYHRETLNNLAWILCDNLGRLEEARDLADRGLARYPEDPHLLDTRAVVLLKQGRLEEAAADLEKCVELAEKVPSTEARALLRLSRLAAQRGDAASARERARQARQIDDEHQVLTVDERAEVERIITQVPAGTESSDQAQS